MGNETKPKTGIEQMNKDPTIQEINKNKQMVKEQYARLKSIPVGQIEKYSALVVNVPIGDLSYKDAKRCVYALADGLVKKMAELDKVKKELDNKKDKIEKILESLNKVQTFDEFAKKFEELKASSEKKV